MPVQRTQLFFSRNAILFFSSRNMQPLRARMAVPRRCLSRFFPENVLNKYTFGTMALKGEEIYSAKNETILVAIQHSVCKQPESRAPENQTRPHIWPGIHNVCLPQNLSAFFYPFRWSPLIGHKRALSTDSRGGGGGGG